jgi:hypothetical protein
MDSNNRNDEREVVNDPLRKRDQKAQSKVESAFSSYPEITEKTI